MAPPYRRLAAGVRENNGITSLRLSLSGGTRLNDAKLTSPARTRVAHPATLLADSADLEGTGGPVLGQGEDHRLLATVLVVDLDVDVHPSLEVDRADGVAGDRGFTRDSCGELVLRLLPLS